MFNLIAMLIGGGLGYLRGRSHGIIGLIAIGLTILAFWKWEFIYRFLNWIGLWTIFENIGIVNPDSHYPTWKLILFFLGAPVVLAIIAGAVMLVFFVLMVIFGALDDATNGKATIILYAPLLLLVVPFLYLSDKIKYFLNPEYRREVDEKKKIAKIPLTERLLDEGCQPISLKEAEIRLNRLPTYGDNLFLFGVKENEKDKYLYILMPRPLHTDDYESHFYKMEIPVIKCTVQKWVEPKDSKIHLNKKYDLVFQKTENGLFIRKENLHSFNQIYKTDFQEVLNVFAGIKFLDEYKQYVDKTQQIYFRSKDMLVTAIEESIETDQDKYERLVKTLRTEYDASNDEIVRIMKGSKLERQGN